MLLTVSSQIQTFYILSTKCVRNALCLILDSIFALVLWVPRVDFLEIILDQVIKQACAEENPEHGKRQSSDFQQRAVIFNRGKILKQRKQVEALSPSCTEALSCFPHIDRVSGMAISSELPISGSTYWSCVLIAVSFSLCVQLPC